MIRRELVLHRLERAKESLVEAGLMLEGHHFNTAVSRAYYSAFYAVTALLETEGLASAKHSGVRALLNQHFIKTGKLPKELGRAYADLFEDRQEGDYADMIRFDRDTALTRSEQAKETLIQIEAIVNAWLEAHP